MLNFSRRKSAVFLLIGAILAGLIYFAPSPWGVVLLEKHPLEPGDSLVVLKIMGEHPISERIGDFYVDEPGALQLIKSKWVTGAPAPFFLCGYHYRLHVISKGAVQESFDLNLESGCNTIVNEKGEARWFNPSLIEKFEDIYQKPRIDNKSFETLKLAREYLASTKGDPRALMTEEPEWTRFDGTFNFDYACDAAKGEGESEEACLTPAEDEVPEPGIPARGPAPDLHAWKIGKHRGQAVLHGLIQEKVRPLPREERRLDSLQARAAGRLQKLRPRAGIVPDTR